MPTRNSKTGTAAGLIPPRPTLAKLHEIAAHGAADAECAANIVCFVDDLKEAARLLKRAHAA